MRARRRRSARTSRCGCSTSIRPNAASRSPWRRLGWATTASRRRRCRPGRRASPGRPGNRASPGSPGSGSPASLGNPGSLASHGSRRPPASSSPPASVRSATSSRPVGSAASRAGMPQALHGQVLPMDSIQAQELPQPAAAEPRIDLRGVSLCYRLAKQRIHSFKDYAIHFMKGSLAYEQLWALRDVALTIHSGETVGIVGRNGAGKSTLLKVISRVLKPTTGDAMVRGSLSPILELGTGFDRELTGFENIYLNALLLGHSRREVADAIDEIVDFSGLGDFVRAPIRNYSTGMLARLGFAVATAWLPDIMILDEVLAVGDGSV